MKGFGTLSMLNINKIANVCAREEITLQKQNFPSRINLFKLNLVKLWASGRKYEMELGHERDAIYYLISHFLRETSQSFVSKINYTHISYA